MIVARGLYRLLAGAFPHEFKLAYGAEMTQLGDDVVDEIARRQGLFGLLRLLADVVIRMPVEYLTEMRHDIRYALRGLGKSPGFAFVGIVSMGLGIGLTTMVYSSKWKVITRPLPGVANAARLVVPEKPVSYDTIEHYREQGNLVSGVAALRTGIPFNVTFEGDRSGKPERVFGQLVSADYFSVLGVPPQRGRLLSPLLDKAGNAPVVVVSDRFWRHRLNASPGAVGETLRLNGQLATIVGITPENFYGALSINPADLFVPITVPAALAPELGQEVLHDRSAREFAALICLAPGVSSESAEAALDSLTRHLEEQDIPARVPGDQARRVTLLSASTMVPLPKILKRAIAGFYLALMGLIMVIACMNLANMLLARGASRRKEWAIRLSVGASRARIVRQMVSEGFLLALLGGLLGFQIAYILALLNSRFIAPSAIPVASDFLPDGHAALFVFALSVACGVGFSLAPALRATRADLTPALKESALQLQGYRRVGLRNLLMVAQVAGSLMVLLVTGFLVIGIAKSSEVRMGFDPHAVYVLSMDPVRDGYTPEEARTFFERLSGRLRSLPGVRGAVLAAQEPFSVQDDPVQVTALDAQGASRIEISAIEETVGGGYFGALHEPMMAGRDFAEADERSSGDEGKALPVIVNENAALQMFGKTSPLGGRMKVEERAYEVVGVVHNLRAGIGPTRAVVYLPLTERNFARPPADGITVIIRSDPGADVLGAIRSEIAFLDPRVTVFNVRTVGDLVERTRASERLAVNTYGSMGIFGLVLASLGLAGITAYAVAQRRKEIGIRVALGAGKGQVVALVLREAAALVSVGTLLGFAGAFFLERALSAMLSVVVDAFGFGRDDLRLLVGAPLLLAVVAMLGSFAPARRAALIDPLKALRQQ